MKWKDVLRKLGLSEPEIENVCVNHREYGVEEMFYQSLLKWKKHLGEEATTEKLCDVLREVRCTEALKKLRGGMVAKILLYFSYHLYSRFDCIRNKIRIFN